MLECQTIFYGDSSQDGTVGQHFVEPGLQAPFRCFNSLIIKCVLIVLIIKCVPDLFVIISYDTMCGGNQRYNLASCVWGMVFKEGCGVQGGVPVCGLLGVQSWSRTSSFRVSSVTFANIHQEYWYGPPLYGVQWPSAVGIYPKWYVWGDTRESFNR